MSVYFERGYKYVLDNVGGAIGAEISQAWIDSINQNIESMTQDMLSTAQQKKLDVDRLQGFMAEIWHTRTFNANASIHHSAIKADQPDVNTYASPDVTIDRQKAQLKYYKTAAASVDAISKPVDEKHYSQGFGKKGQTMYHGFQKVIPSGQIESAKLYVQDQIEMLKVENTPEAKIRIKQLREIQRTLSDVVSAKGNESVPLTREQAGALATAAKEGKIDKELLAECGLDINKLVTAKDIACESLKAGLSAATFSLILSITPTIVNGISMLISSGEIDVETLKEGGASALPTSARSFLSGSITAALNTSCQTGKLGEALVGADPMVISTLVVVTIGTICSALKLASGKISKAEMAHEIMQMYVTTAFSYAGGVALAALCEGFPFAYMIGSFIGGIVGGFIYSATEKLFMSFCVDSGCTFFGLVDQNYTLPERVIEELGLEQFNFEKMTIEQFEYDTFSIDRFSLDSFEYERFGIEILRRDLIGVYSVGYV